ncbi:hypothetical protein P4S72_24925 [Vibrio sp. PP-XX7]
MFMIEGVCDWCKHPALLAKHQYIDGKVYYSCQNCYAFACMDVRLYNNEEQEIQTRQQAKFAANPNQHAL